MRRLVAEHNIGVTVICPGFVVSPMSERFVGGKPLMVTADVAAVSAGTEILGNGRNAVLKRNGYTVSFIYRDSATGGTVNGAPASIPLSYAGGDAVEVNAPAAITGYGLTGVTIDQGTGGTLSAQADAGAVDFCHY